VTKEFVGLIVAAPVERAGDSAKQAVGRPGNSGTCIGEYIGIYLSYY